MRTAVWFVPYPQLHGEGIILTGKDSRGIPGASDSGVEGMGGEGLKQLVEGVKAPCRSADFKQVHKLWQESLGSTATCSCVCDFHCQLGPKADHAFQKADVNSLFG